MKVSIVYDGMCPVCSRLAAASRLRARTDELNLIDARTDALDDVQDNDLSKVDFNQGFAVVVDGRAHLGADGAQVLAALTEPSGFWFRVFQMLVASERRSSFFYPVLRFGRSLLLRLMGIPPITCRGKQEDA